MGCRVGDERLLSGEAPNGLQDEKTADASAVTRALCGNNEVTCFCYYGKPLELYWNHATHELTDFYFTRRVGINLQNNARDPFLDPVADSNACSILGGRELTVYFPMTMRAPCGGTFGDYACVGPQLPTRPNGRNRNVECRRRNGRNTCWLVAKACTLDWGTNSYVRYPEEPTAAQLASWPWVDADGPNDEEVRVQVNLEYIGQTEDNMGPSRVMSRLVAAVCGAYVDSRNRRWPPNTACDSGDRVGMLGEKCRNLWRSCKRRPQPREGGTGSHLCAAMSESGWQ